MVLLLTGALLGAELAVASYLEQFEAYRFLWEKNMQKEYQDFLATDPTLEVTFTPSYPSSPLITYPWGSPAPPVPLCHPCRPGPVTLGFHPLALPKLALHPDLLSHDHADLFLDLTRTSTMGSPDPTLT